MSGLNTYDNGGSLQELAQDKKKMRKNKREEKQSTCTRSLYKAAGEM
tara:strand:+ start:641 stop:781 length:141 start_codon:yes stop_codon:yes gene_type:complete